MITIRCTKEGKANVAYTLLAGQTYTIGRKGGDITFPEDPSVSRNHAEITVEHPLANVGDPLLVPTVVVTDLGSKFGTFANDGIARKSQMSMREPMNLSPGDRFKFGMQWNEFKIEYTPLIVTPSTIKEPLKLKNIIMTLAGHVVQEWTDQCNYVVMESLTLTVKAICALLSARHIVTPSFFDDLLECVKTKKGRPDPNNYLPVFGEKSLQAHGLSFEPNVARTQLFQGKTFLFASNKHIKKVGVAIKCGGGTCDLISSVSKKHLLDDNYIIITPSDKDMATMDEQTEFGLQTYKKKKRTIQESELGLAAVYVSIEKHCNPNYSFTDVVFPKLVSQTQASSSTSERILAPETQDIPTQKSTQSDSVKVVEETFITKVKEEPSSESSRSAAKRSANGQDTGDAPSSKKRSATETLTRKPELSGSTTTRSSKRLRPDNNAALSSIFGFSDSDDEEDETVNPNEASVIEACVDVVPDSPPIFDLDEDVADNNNPVEMAVVEEPPKDPEPEQQRSTRSTRSKVNSQVEPVPQSQGSSSKRKLPSPEAMDSHSENTSTKKRKTKEVNENTAKLIDSVKAMSEKVETLCIKTEIKEDVDGPISAKISIITIPLLTGAKVEPNIQIVNGKSIKNFKPFRKVLPLRLQRENNSAESTSGRNSVVINRTLNLTYKDSPCQSVPLDVPNRRVRNESGEPEVPIHENEQKRNEPNRGIFVPFDKQRSTAPVSRSEARSSRSTRSQRLIEDSPDSNPFKRPREVAKRTKTTSDVPLLCPPEMEVEDEDDIWNFS